jgi:CopG antitoxin of type II toxin-antitoxin system
LSRPAHAPSRIPIFETLEEEAEFWDTDDSTEFEDEFEPVDWEISEVRSRFFLHAEVDLATLRRVRELARAQGLKADELAGRWVQEGFARALADADRPPSNQDPRLP